MALKNWTHLIGGVGFFLILAKGMPTVAHVIGWVFLAFYGLAWLAFLDELRKERRLDATFVNGILRADAQQGKKPSEFARSVQEGDQRFKPSIAEVSSAVPSQSFFFRPFDTSPSAIEPSRDEVALIKFFRAENGVLLECLAQWLTDTTEGREAIGRFIRRLDEQFDRNRRDTKQFNEASRRELQDSGPFRSWLLDSPSGQSAVARWQRAVGQSIGRPWTHDGFWQWFFEDQQASQDWLSYAIERDIGRTEALLARVRIKRLLSELDEPHGELP